MTFAWPIANYGMLHPGSARTDPRRQAAIFMEMARLSQEGVSYPDMKPQFDMSSNAVETRMAFFASLGLLFHAPGSDHLTLTPVGHQLYDLAAANPNPTGEAKDQLTAVLTWALSNCQINRPVSPGSPHLTPQEKANCDIRPCATAWSVMLDLGGLLYLHELVGPLRALQKVADYDACVQSIVEARAGGHVFVEAAQWGTGAPLMNPMIYWRSQLSLAGELLRYDTPARRLAFVPGAEVLVRAILEAQRHPEGDPLFAITARPWTTIQDYFEVAGRKCPAAILNGSDELPAVDIAVPAAPEGAGPGGAGAAPPAGGQSAEEGERRFRYQASIERSSWASRQAKRLNAALPDHGGKVTCEVCDFAHADFAMLDAHHEKPLSEGVRKTRPEDLRILCPTCHRRAHRSANKGIPYTLDELRQWVSDGRP